MAPKPGHFRTKRVPQRGHPLIRFMVEEINRQRKTYCQISAQAGVFEHFAHRWTHGSDPQLSKFEAVLNTLGYRLTVEKIDEQT